MQAQSQNKAYYWGNRNYFVFSGYFFTYSLLWQPVIHS
ncbi:galactoside permease [Actinobacillus equuli]|nr:galactoside permease [Actinobacillus equuli]